VPTNRPLAMLVDPPRRQPMPFGIFTVVEERDVTDPHYLLGVEYRPLCGGSGTTFDYCVTGGPGPAFAPTASRSMRAATPFTVFSEVQCSALDAWEIGNEDAVNMLKATEQYQVERALWTGQVGGLDNQMYPHLAANAAVTAPLVTNGIQLTLQTAAVQVTGSGVSAATGIGLLEGALGACYDGVGILHVPETAIPALANLNMIFRDGKNLRTHNGNLVVAGAGYTGSSPSGVAATPGTTWMYATGQFFMYRGPIKTFARETELNRSNNTFTAIAQRTYVLGWDCCHFAVQINTGSVG
jgi:hypothetical protein